MLCTPVVGKSFAYERLPVFSARRLALEWVHLGSVRKGVRDGGHEGVRRDYPAEGARAWHGHAHPPEGTQLDLEGAL